MRELAVAGVLVASLAMASCGSEDSATATGESAAATTSASPTSTEATSVEPLVGEWQRVIKCEELVRLLEEAGFPEAAAGVGGEFGVSDPDPAHPCKGAVPRKHSHFFTADGLFGSLDDYGNQVDEGTYEIVDDRTFVIPYGFEQGEPVQVTFHYRIQGDTIMFDPVIPADCSTKHCHEAAVWSVTVAYEGRTWKRVG